ncbi:MAG: CAP domain-containing protein [Sphingobacteriales bacterium]|nr:MAG: CAP domain-containing protein [Sphingobacteriales bacterium]
MNLKRIFLFLLLAGGIITTNLANAQDKLEQQILVLVNQYRADHKLPPLELFNTINTAAEKHSGDMASKRVPFGHAGFDARIDGLLDNIKGAEAAAENVAYGPTTAEEVVKMWIASSGHRKNIEGNFNLTGIGIAQDKNGRPYYTQIFVSKK